MYRYDQLRRLEEMYKLTVFPYLNVESNMEAKQIYMRRLLDEPGSNFLPPTEILEPGFNINEIISRVESIQKQSADGNWQPINDGSYRHLFLKGCAGTRGDTVVRVRATDHVHITTVPVTPQADSRSDSAADSEARDDRDRDGLTHHRKSESATVTDQRLRLLEAIKRSNRCIAVNISQLVQASEKGQPLHAYATSIPGPVTVVTVDPTQTVTATPSDCHLQTHLLLQPFLSSLEQCEVRCYYFGFRPHWSIACSSFANGVGTLFDLDKSESRICELERKIQLVHARGFFHDFADTVLWILERKIPIGIIEHHDARRHGGSNTRLDE